MCLYTHKEKHAYFWNTKVNILAKLISAMELKSNEIAETKCFLRK